MFRFLSDENFDGEIVDGLLHMIDAIDLVRVQDVGLMSTPDDVILEWCAAQNRILLTHDVSTVPDYAHTRVAAGLAMPGVFLCSDQDGVSLAMSEIRMIVACSQPEEWAAKVVYLPLR